MDRCKRCSEWVWSSRSHACPPKWKCFDVDNDPDMVEPREIFAVDAEQAAERAFEEFCWEDPSSAPDQEQSQPVIVRDANGKETKWNVHYLMEPTYHAREADDE